MKTYQFQARIEAADRGGAYVVFPYDVEQEFGMRDRVPVKAVINGVPYAGSLIKCDGPVPMLPVLKEIRERTGKTIGDMVAVELHRDEAERTVDVPEDLANLLKCENLRAVFDKLSYTHRREYCRWITEAKRAETRVARLAKAAGMLRDGIKTPD
jgi:hypothetical protein